MNTPYECEDALLYWYGMIIKDYQKKPKRANFQIIKMIQNFQTMIEREKPKDFFEITGIAQNVSLENKKED